MFVVSVSFVSFCPFSFFVFLFCADGLSLLESCSPVENCSKTFWNEAKL